MWTVILAASLGCYLLKFSGMIVPERFLDHPRIQHIVTLLPVALLAALIAVQVFTDRQELVVDARLGGILVALAAVRFRAPFLLVVFSACAATALLRLAG